MIDRFKNCRTITELVSLSYEEPLTLVQKLSVKMHCCFCQECRQFDKNNQMLKNIIAKHKQLK